MVACSYNHVTLIALRNVYGSIGITLLLSEFVALVLIFRDTYVERIRGESPNDYNDRMIRIAALWYNKHLNDQVKVLLLSSDEASRSKAFDEGIPTISCKYLKYLLVV